MTADEASLGDPSMRGEVDWLFDRLEQLARGGGYASPTELREFKRCVQELSAIDLGPRSGYIREKLLSAEGHAESLFSARKHQQWEHGTQAGEERLRAMIRADLSVARGNIFAHRPTP